MRRDRQPNVDDVAAMRAQAEDISTDDLENAVGRMQGREGQLSEWATERLDVYRSVLAYRYG